MRKLLLFLILLIILLAVTDRVAVAGVERDLANRIAAATDVSGTPEVEIIGVPFLTQAVSGHYPEVRFDIGTLRYGGVPIEDLKGAAYDVTAPLADLLQNRADIRAGRIAVSGTLTNATIDRFAPQGVKIRGKGDRFVASGELVVRAQKVEFTAEMKAELTDDGIRLQAEKIEGVPAALARFVNYTIPFKGKLPFDVKVTEVRSVPGGLQISAEASDVPLRG